MKIRTKFEIPQGKEQVKKALGTRLGRSLNRPKIVEKFNNVVADLYSLIEPKVGWDIFKVRNIENGKFLLENGVYIGEGPMMEVLKESTEVVISLATIGNGIDEKIQQFQAENKRMEAVLLDSVGSWLVGRVQNQFEFELKSELKEQGYFHNINFAPGDTEWPIEDQKVIFDLLEPEKLDMRLTNVLLMIPQKSLTSLFGISNVPFVLDHVKRCEFCERKETCRIYTAGGI